MLAASRGHGHVPWLGGIDAEDCPVEGGLSHGDFLLLDFLTSGILLGCMVLLFDIVVIAIE